MGGGEGQTAGFISHFKDYWPREQKGRGPKVAPLKACEAFGSSVTSFTHAERALQPTGRPSPNPSQSPPLRGSGLL